jgi:hypothetical protein
VTGVDGCPNEKNIIISITLAIVIVNLSVCGISGKEVFDGP